MLPVSLISIPTLVLATTLSVGCGGGADRGGEPAAGGGGGGGVEQPGPDGEEDPGPSDDAGVPGDDPSPGRDPDAGADPDPGVDPDPDPDPDPNGDGDPAPALEPSVVPEFGTKEGGRRLEVIANARQGLRTPRDLEFNPDIPSELWIVDERLEGAILVFDATSDDRTFETRIDAAGAHFMSHVSSLAFGAPGTFATCQESRNEVDPTSPDFMGPSLWPSDLDVFAAVGQRGEGGRNGSHLDMLHQSPLCMGIAHEAANVYWVADGAGGPRGSGGLPHIVRYDFGRDHGPGRSDHSDGRVLRYVQAQFHPVAGVPSHLARDPGSDWLYYVETGRGQVRRLDTSTGEITRDLPLNHETLAQYAEIGGAVVEDFVVDGLQRPSGIAIGPERIFVSDFETAELVAYSHAGVELGRMDTDASALMGIALGPDGHLWYADGAYAEVVRILPGD